MVSGHVEFKRDVGCYVKYRWLYGYVSLLKMIIMPCWFSLNIIGHFKWLKDHGIFSKVCLVHYCILLAITAVVLHSIVVVSNLFGLSALFEWHMYLRLARECAQGASLEYSLWRVGGCLFCLTYSIFSSLATTFADLAAAAKRPIYSVVIFAEIHSVAGRIGLAVKRAW